MKRYWLPVICFFILLLPSCMPSLDVFEKDVALPHQQWESGFRPQIVFSIRDTSARYNIYIVIRHTDAYNFNNIWVRATVQQPGDPGSHSQRYDLSLATNQNGWLGVAMDDIYESRILIQSQTKFNRPGDYIFSLQQVMREDPLRHVLNVGVRVEKEM